MRLSTHLEFNQHHNNVEGISKQSDTATCIR